MRIKAFKSHGMNRVIVKSIGHAVNNHYKGMSRNERLKDEVYNYKNDDEFYETYSKYPRSEIKNRYILQRLREIEYKRNSGNTDSTGLIITIFIFILFLVLFLTNMIATYI